MKKINIFGIFLCLVMICLILFTACGKNESGSTTDISAPSETTIVLETTSDSRIIEQDSEGNKITKDENGNVISVEDKNGNPVDVTEYLTNHTWVESNGGSSGSNSSGGTGSSVVPRSSEGNNPSGTDSGSTSDIGPSDHGGAVEESIPVIIATIPADEDMVELPDL